MNNTQRITALENRFDSLDVKLDRLLAAVSPSEPAKVERKVTAKPQVRAAKATKVTLLSKGSRKAFIKAHSWAQDGMSTQVLASMAVQENLPLAKGWGIGEGYRAMFAL